MLVNNIDIKNFGACLLEKKIGTAEFICDQEWFRNAYKPLILNKENKYTPIECTFVLKAITRQDLEEKVSNFLKQLEECVLKFYDVDFYYSCTTKSKSNEYIGIDITDDLEVESIAVSLVSEFKYKSEIIETLSKVTSKTINIPGNLKTPCIVEIVPSIDIIDLIINGLSDDPIIIKNLKVNQKVIINGEDSTVLQNGVNKFGETDMWEFPTLKPGNNTISLSKDSCDVVIRYKSRWI